ncbi:MAG: hypothetical protein ACD_79C00988G0004 [uncultured bacterium]|nr:MAG: hypothetical protein ACD_79C00988G0004 [uncultured bacterium]
MKKFFMIIMIVVGVGINSYASEKNWGINLEYGASTSEFDVSTNGVIDYMNDRTSIMGFTGEYKFNPQVGIYFGLQNGIFGTIAFDSEDHWYYYDVDFDGMGIVLGGKYYFENGIFFRFGVGKTVVDGKYTLDRFHLEGGSERPGGNMSSPVVLETEVDVDDPMTADFAIGYQFFSDRAFSFGATAGYRYMDEITADLPMGYSITVDTSNPYVAANISIKW